VLDAYLERGEGKNVIERIFSGNRFVSQILENDYRQ